MWHVSTRVARYGGTGYWHARLHGGSHSKATGGDGGGGGADRGLDLVTTVGGCGWPESMVEVGGCEETAVVVGTSGGRARRRRGGRREQGDPVGAWLIMEVAGGVVGSVEGRRVRLSWMMEDDDREWKRGQRWWWRVCCDGRARWGSAVGMAGSLARSSSNQHGWEVSRHGWHGHEHEHGRARRRWRRRRRDRHGMDWPVVTVVFGDEGVGVGVSRTGRWLAGDGEGEGGRQWHACMEGCGRDSLEEGGRRSRRGEEGEEAGGLRAHGCLMGCRDFCGLK